MGKSLLCGVGINDSDYTVTKYKKNENGKWCYHWVCPYYLKWSNMIKRCYSPRDLKRRPSYVGSYVCEEWLTFSNFKAWMEKQDWEGKELDKDIRCKGEPIYSPETCVFIDHLLNTALTLRVRGDYPIGVSKQKGYRYKALISGGCKIKTDFLGYYDTPEEAHRAWQLAKIRVIERLSNSQENSHVKDDLLKIAHSIWVDVLNNVETIKINRGV